MKHGLSCGAKCARYILIIFNFFFWLSGAAILGVGIWLKLDKTALKYFEIVTADEDGALIDIAVWTLIGVGAFVFVVGFLGCRGAMDENTCMLCWYGGLLFLILLLEIIAGVLAFVFKRQLDDYLRDSMTSQIKEKYKEVRDIEGGDALSSAWNYMQWQFDCCGASNYTDYRNSTFVLTSPDPVVSVSEHCCVPENKSDITNPNVKNWLQCQIEGKTTNLTKDSKFLHVKGCYSSLLQWITKHSIILIAVGIGIAVVQLFGAIFACWLRSDVLKKRSRQKADARGRQQRMKEAVALPEVTARRKNVIK